MATDMFGNPLDEEERFRLMMGQQALGLTPTLAPTTTPMLAGPAVDTFVDMPAISPVQQPQFDFTTPTYAPTYSVDATPTFNTDPVTLNQALAGPLSVLNQEATGTITPTEDVNLAGMPFAGAVTGANELINKAPFVSANPLSVLAKTEMLPSIFNYDAGPVVQNVFDTIMPTADAAEKPVSPQTDQDYLNLGVTPQDWDIAHPAQSPLLDQRYLEQPDKQTVTQNIDVTGAEPAFEMFRPGEDLGMVDPTWADSGGWGVPQETVSLPEILSYAAPLPALGLLGKIPAVGKALTSAEKAMRRNILKGAAGVATLGAAGKLGPGAINRALDLAKSSGVETFEGIKSVPILDKAFKTIGWKNVTDTGKTISTNIGKQSSKKGTDKTPYDWAGAPIGASVAEIVSNAKTAPTGNLERIAARRSAELARQQQAAADKRAADRLAAQQAQEAAAQAQAASAAQAQAAQNAARAVLASAAGRDRGGPSSREIAAAIEVLSGVDSFGSGGMRNTRGEVGMDETGYTDTSGYGVG